MNITFTRTPYDVDGKSCEVYVENRLVGWLMKDKYALMSEWFFQHAQHGSQEDHGSNLREAKRDVTKWIKEAIARDSGWFWEHID